MICFGKCCLHCGTSNLSSSLEPQLTEPINSTNFGFYAGFDQGADFGTESSNWGESAAIDNVTQGDDWMDHQGWEDPGFNPI
jgi:hypothetical protein